MAKTIQINLSDMYVMPTQKDITKAKKWMRLRNDNAEALATLVESLLEDAVEQLTVIAYKYNCKPEDFHFAQDEKLREEVAGVMSALETDVMDLTQAYALKEPEADKHHALLLAWLLALKSKNTENFQQTLHLRLQQFLFDTEASLAAMLIAGHNQTVAKTKAVSTMHAVYTAPEVVSAFKKKSAAAYILSRGIHYGGNGLSSSGANNVENFARQTAVMTWMKSQLLQYYDEGAAGYYQLRGSNYPCQICDDAVGLHIGDYVNDLFPHAHCQCYRIPIFHKSVEQLLQEKLR